MPPSERCSAIQDVLDRALQAIRLAGQDIDAALPDAAADVQDQRGR